jgi:RHS repeat-associated protein
MRTAAPGASRGYPYGGTAYANPDAVTQIANGVSTTTFTYDNNGNVTQKTVDGTTTTYVYDYANRLTALGAGGATTTYGYDAFGQRVLQTGTTTTYLYPFKWYSVASSTGSGVKYATTTDYIFNGDTLLATVDQQTASGNATGTAKTRYVHPDQLGSTNVVTDENAVVVQSLDYYPYGSTRISSATSTNEKRKYIGQFLDDSTLSYLNARYYDSGRGQFTSEDPVFYSTSQNLSSPQSLNPYSYADDNPITKSDPSGKMTGVDDLIASGIGGLLFFDIYTVQTALAHEPETWAGAGNAFVTGSIMAEGIDNAPATGGTSIEAALLALRGAATVGAKAGFFGNATEQSINYFQGNQSGYNWKDLSLSTAKGAATIVLFSAFPDACIPGFSCGINNLNSIGKSMSTSLGNGYISKVSSMTSFKAAVGSEAAETFRTAAGAILSGNASQGSAPYLAGQIGVGNKDGPFIGTYNFGPGIGTFNFGTGKWK